MKEEQESAFTNQYCSWTKQHPVIEREKQVMSGESKGVTRLNKVMIAECCYRKYAKENEEKYESSWKQVSIGNYER